MSMDEFESVPIPAWVGYGAAVMMARRQLGAPPSPVTWEYASRALQVARSVHREFGTPVRDVVADLADHGQPERKRARSDIKMAAYALRLGCPASMSVPVAVVAPVVRADLSKDMKLRLLLELDAMGRSSTGGVTLQDARRLAARELVDSDRVPESGEAE